MDAARRLRCAQTQPHTSRGLESDRTRSESLERLVDVGKVLVEWCALQRAARGGRRSTSIRHWSSAGRVAGPSRRRRGRGLAGRRRWCRRLRLAAPPRGARARPGVGAHPRGARERRGACGGGGARVCADVVLLLGAKDAHVAEDDAAPDLHPRVRAVGDVAPHLPQLRVGLDRAVQLLLGQRRLHVHGLEVGGKVL